MFLVYFDKNHDEVTSGGGRGCHFWPQSSLTKVKEIKVGIGFGAFSVDKNLRLGLYVTRKDKISISGLSI